MSQMFRTTLRLDLDKPASANAVALLRQLHAERGLSYSALIVPAFRRSMLIMASQPCMKACGRRFAPSSRRSWQLHLFSLVICCKR